MELDPRDTTITPKEEAMVKAILRPLMGAIAASNSEGLIGTRDLTKLLAFATAAIVDSDEEVVTPRDIRQSGEYFGKLVAYHAKALRTEGAESGSGFMADFIAGE
jgi:hypothetical protein